MSDLTDVKGEYVLVVTIHIQNPKMKFMIEALTESTFVDENRCSELLSFDKTNTEKLFFSISSPCGM